MRPRLSHLKGASALVAMLLRAVMLWLRRSKPEAAPAEPAVNPDPDESDGPATIKFPTRKPGPRPSGAAAFIAAMLLCMSATMAQTAPADLTMHLSPATRAWYRNPDGSCVQCSLGMAGVHCNDLNAATLLWDTEFGPAERGGSWPSRVAEYCDRRGIVAFNVTGLTVDDTIPWMTWAAKTGRFAAIGCGTAHFQTLYGYDPEKREWLVCNNNSTDRIDRYSDQQFRELHRASGPWCVILQRPTSTPPQMIKWWK